MNYFDNIINECFDITDSKTRKTLLSLNEAEQNKVLISLSNNASVLSIFFMILLIFFNLNYF